LVVSQSRRASRGVVTRTPAAGASAATVRCGLPLADSAALRVSDSDITGTRVNRRTLRRAQMEKDRPAVLLGEDVDACAGRRQFAAGR
jgi:hypothetical protein